MSEAKDIPGIESTRRTFVKAGAATVATGAAAGFPSVTFGKKNDKKLKVGVVGCGGRGGGAMMNSMNSDDNIELWAMGDLYIEEAEKKLAMVRKYASVRDKVAPDIDGRVFGGLDCFEKVMDSGIDIVLLTTPPAFRPQHFKAAIERDLHAFVEKPCATDVAGVFDFLDTAKLAKDKGLSVLCGFCYRYSEHGRPLFQRIHDGAIGDVVSIHSTYYASPVKAMPDPSSRHHFGITYEYPNDVKAHVEWRQFLTPSYQFTGDTIVGTKGVAKFGTSSAEVTGENPWRWRKPRTPKNMYDIEHEEFVAAIRSGERKDDAEWVAHSTTMAILGREACYTGKRLTWDQLEESRQKLVPDNVDLAADLPIRPMRIPGVMETQGPLGQKSTA